MCLMNVVMYEEKVMRLGYASNVYGYVLGYVKATWLESKILMPFFCC